MTNCNSKGSCGYSANCCCPAHCDCVPKSTTKNCIGCVGPVGPVGSTGVSGDDGHKFLCIDDLITGLIGDICDADDGTEVGQYFLCESSGMLYQWTGTDWALLNSTTAPETPFYYKVDVLGGFNIYLLDGDCPFTITELCDTCPLGTKLLNCYTSEIFELGLECLWNVGCFVGGPEGVPGTDVGPTGPDGEDFSATIGTVELGGSPNGTELIITTDGSPSNGFSLPLTLVVP